MEENNIKVWLAACYVDDVRFLTSIIEKGRRWDAKKKIFDMKKEWLEEDQKVKTSDEKRTATELRKVMNSIFSNIQFTLEIPEDFLDGRLPTLDFACWLEEGGSKNEMDHQEDPEAECDCRQDHGEGRQKIIYSFYEKPMNSPFSILERSALPESTKMSSLTQEVVRRMANTSEDVPQEERNQIVENLI